MRQIALDTETTGIGSNHKIIEIGCVEIIDRVITNNNFHIYLNPRRKVDEQAFRVHGLSNEFLDDKPEFFEIMNDFLDFVKNSELIIHNAPFDIGFLNYELECARYPSVIENCCKIFDTLVFAKNIHPGQRNSLDALCKRYEVDNSNRELHGALLDAQLLARVYLKMTGGQTMLFEEPSIATANNTKPLEPVNITEIIETRTIFANESELCAHEDYLKLLAPLQE